MIILKLIVDKDDLDLERVAKVVNIIHRLVVLELEIDEDMASPVRVSYSIISKDIMQEGNIKP